MIISVLTKDFATSNFSIYWNEHSFEEIPDSLIVAKWNDSCWENAGQYAAAKLGATAPIPTDPVEKWTASGSRRRLQYFPS